jgi:hypothetical protein
MSDDDEMRFTPRDVIVFAFRDKHPGLWADADDFADHLLTRFSEHQYAVLGPPHVTVVSAEAMNQMLGD